jgi:formamidopyrimidine-DNA glycosylase
VDLAQMMTGQRISDVERRAKYLLLTCANGRAMIHLGMSGSLRVLPDDAVPGKHDHVDFELDGGQLLRYRDPRRFGSIFWVPAGESHWLLDELGPEPLSDDFDGDYLFRTSRGRKTPVKVFLMNSRVVVGVGNIYANEALYLAGIRPDRLARSVSRARFLRLGEAVKRVLASAIDAGGTTLRDFVREDGSPGYFRHDLKVYGRGGEPCMACGRPLKEIRLGQRTTVFCTRCQR